MYKFFIFIFLNTFILVSASSQVLRVSTDQNTKQWLAVIDDEYDCEEMKNKVRQIQNSYLHGRYLGEETIESLDSVLDCFVMFEGPDELINIINNTDGVIDIAMNEFVNISESWARDRIDQQSLPLDNSDYNNAYTGKDVDIFILDTGIFLDHIEYNDRAYYGGDFIQESIVPEDFHGHGTHTASLAAGRSKGTAVEANVYGVKVLSKHGYSKTDSVIKGIQWASNAIPDRASVLSLSLGGGRNTALDKAVNDASKDNIVIVAAGNNNQDACKYSPAAAENAITVGASTIYDSRSSFSNYGSCLTIFAPGSGIHGASHKGPYEYVYMSGTSMATPLVAGAAATLLEKHNFDKTAAVGNLLSIAASNKLSYINSHSPNLLLQVETKIRPPTPPTKSPTIPPTSFPTVSPTPTPILICQDNIHKDCYEYRNSLFNPRENENYSFPLNGILTSPPINEIELCKPTQENFTNKIVLVRRGSCLFFDKVKNAENAGAKGVIIMLDNDRSIYPPAYYGEGSTSIFSCIISRNSGLNMLKYLNTNVIWGISVAPTSYPTKSPFKPTQSPSTSPSVAPTNNPTTLNPTISPSYTPTTPEPTNRPSRSPTKNPTITPTSSPTKRPTRSPTTSSPTPPTNTPTNNTTMTPTSNPTMSPTNPTRNPTKNPTITPTLSPTISPSLSPTNRPTQTPTNRPTENPTISPTVYPTHSPNTQHPTMKPTNSPNTPTPTKSPSNPPTFPTTRPTRIITKQPTISQTIRPSKSPTSPTFPTKRPTKSPNTPHPTKSPIN